MRGPAAGGGEGSGSESADSENRAARPRTSPYGKPLILIGIFYLPIVASRLEYGRPVRAQGGNGMTGGTALGGKLKLMLVLGVMALGFYVGLNLSEEKKHRVRKLLLEAREMPFRLFV